MRIPRWAVPMAVAVSLTLLASAGPRLLVDRRVRLHTLVTLDPPPAPAAVHVGPLTLIVTGALIMSTGLRDLRLHAWMPTPTLRVLDPGDTTALTVRLENLPAAVQLSASGPVEEERSGLTRILRFDPHASREIGFRTPPRDATFVVLGDTGDSDTFIEALRVGARAGADFLLHAGDLVYEDAQMPHIARILATTPLPVFMTRGNHDYRNAARITFMRALGPPYYTFQMGGATFVVLDNADEYLPGLWRYSTQYRWWQQTMAQPRAGPLFVVMHKPPFDRRSRALGAAIADRPFARQLMHDFVQAGADAVFTGHVHETHLWLQDGIPYVINGEGVASPSGVHRNRMAWVRVHDWHVTIEQVPVWDTSVQPGNPRERHEPGGHREMRAPASPGNRRGPAPLSRAAS